MANLKKISCILSGLIVFILCLYLSFYSALAEEEFLEEPDTSKTVESIEIYQMPDKTVYVIGDTFSAEGGVIKVNYTDGTAVLIDMTDDDVEMSAPTMNTANTKNVMVSYMGERTVFQVEVAAGMITVTFDYNYDGAPDALVQEVSSGAQAEEPEIPTRDGYEFIAWYINTDYTQTYDFSDTVSEDLTLYAFWQKTDADYVNVTFDYNYYGVLLSQYSYPVESGTQVSEPAITPERTGYTFSKWVDENGEDFSFEEPVTEDTVITAVWEKDSEEAQTWIFEAEDTDLTGKIGPSYSGSAQEESMIIYNDAIDASGDRVVGYLYESGISLEFPIASDTEVTDAVVTVRITGEYTTMSYDGTEFEVIVNGVALNYDEVTIEITSQSDVPQCEDLIVIEGVSLQEGENLIQLQTNNTKAVDGTTFKANAPLVDCVKITTSAVLIWDENYGVPATDNYK